jgi:hypothetical protein
MWRSRELSYLHQKGRMMSAMRVTERSMALKAGTVTNRTSLREVEGWKWRVDVLERIADDSQGDRGRGRGRGRGREGEGEGLA